MHAEPLARAAAEHGSVHRTGAATIDVLAFPGPAEHAFRAGIARDHPSGSSDACCVSVSMVMVSPELISVCGGSERLK